MERKAEKRDKVQQYAFIGALIAVAIIGVLVIVNVSSGGGEDSEAATDDVGTIDDAVDLAENGPDGEPSEDGEEDGASEESDSDEAEAIECPAEDGSSERTLEFAAAPPTCIDESATYVATFDTNLGEITAELDASAAPVTVNNFVFLARYHYYDDTSFHRIIEDFVIQGGDPNGDPAGTGNPGYFIDEEPPADGTYALGDLAMAKQTAAGTTGGQFFIITGPEGEALPPQYSKFGTVTAGLDVVEEIGTLPTDESDFPTSEIVVNSITISES